MRRPTPRGPLGHLLAEVLDEAPGRAPDRVDALRQHARAVAGRAAGQEVLQDDDVQAVLTTLYELHYRGLDGVDDRWEWDPSLLAARAELEAVFEAALRAAALPDGVRADLDAAAADGVAAHLFALAAADGGPSVSTLMERRATLGQWREFMTIRSVYHLKEADPHTWAIPRLAGRAKAALVEIQADEYGGGRPDLMHSALFARTMRELGLDDTYGRFVDDVPAVVLAHVNTMSLFGLHRRLRAAAVGHLSIVEMTSSLPNRRYGNGLRRLGFGPAATAFFDEHVEADAVHEQIAAHDLAGALVSAEPEVLGDVLFGARAAIAVDVLVGEHLHGCWTRGVSALAGPRPVGPAAVDGATRAA
jgi:hypothetical protein